MAKRLENLMFVRELGTGAGTKVALMRDARDGTQYCKKYVSVNAPNYQSQIRQLKNEFDVGVQNTHPVLRKSVEYGIVKRKLRAIEAYNILQFVEGIPLDKFAESNPLSLIIKTFWHVADGLHDLHRRGFIHADLKPHNILCAKSGRPTIIDFGQACPMLTRKERIQGTKDFIAKEQVDRQALDQRTDIFGLGATMHRIFLGRSVETELNSAAVTKGGINLDFWRDPNTDQSQKLDPALLKLIEDCCQAERADRPDTMQIVKDRLEVSFDRVANTA
ncbi:MAG TPA: protein kinase [Phycisphaerae bacterium]|nr:protein kinase [Phycisphaerae bacterium]